MIPYTRHSIPSRFVYFFILMRSVHKSMGRKHIVGVDGGPDIVGDDVVEQGDPRGVRVGRPLISGHPRPYHQQGQILCTPSRIAKQV